MNVQATLKELVDGQHELMLAISDLSDRMATKDELKELREYTESGFDAMNDRFDDAEDRLDRIEDRLDSITGSKYQH